MLVLQGNRAKMLELLKQGAGESEIVLKGKPSAMLIAAILNGTKAKKIVCSVGIRRTFTKRMLNALAEMGIAVENIDLKRGRPFSVDGKKLERAQGLIKQGKTRKEAAVEAGMSERTLYYLLAKAKKRNV